MTTDPNSPRPICNIAEEIIKDWKNVDHAAYPYLNAMFNLSKTTDKYGLDDAKSIVLYFLSNAGGWKGVVARRIKKELKKMFGIK
jgi:hypothetical protein